MQKGAVFVLLGVLSFSLHAEGPPTLSEKAQALVRDLRASSLGVDEEGNLWTWQFPSGRIDLYSPDGQGIATTNLQGTGCLDVDRRWGVAGVVSQGKELRVLPWEPGATATSISLPDDACGVAWVDAETVAVAPSLANHRAQIWNVREKKLVAKLGAEEVIEPKIGTTVLRSVRLEYLPSRKLLYTLDSFRGDLQVFTLDGRLARHEAFPKVDHGDMDTWLAKTDREMRERHEVFTPGIWWFDMAVDAAGTAWSIPGCDLKTSRATILRIPILGKTSSLALDDPCCARGLVIWNGWLVLHSDPTSSREICNLVRRLP